MKKKLNGSALLILFALSLTTVPSVYPSTSSLASAKPTRLEGYWEAVRPGDDYSITVTGNSLHFYGREDLWYETTFTIPAGTDPQQLHATIIKDSSERERDIGKVVVALFKIEDGTLTLGVIGSFDGLLASPVTDGWDQADDRYYLKRVQPGKNNADAEKPPPPKTP